VYTIKHIETDGQESGQAVLSWQYDRKEKSITAPAPDGITKYVYFTGRVFVMNDSGKTVGDYHLDK